MTVAVVWRERRIAAQAEIFAEEVMPPRLRRSRQPPCRCRFASRLNRIDDPAVAGAPAQMAVERLGDGLAIAGPTVLDERRGAHDDAGNAEAALHGAFEHERLAQHAACLLGKPFERRDGMAGHLFRLAQAGQRRRAVDENQTAAAHPFRSAPVLRGHDAALLAQHLEQVHPGLVARLGRFAVQIERDSRHRGLVLMVSSRVHGGSHGAALENRQVVHQPLVLSAGGPAER